MSLITATPPAGSRARSSVDRSASRRAGAPRLRVVRDEHRAAEVALLRRSLRPEPGYRSQLSSRSTSVFPLVSAPGRSGAARTVPAQTVPAQSRSARPVPARSTSSRASSTPSPSTRSASARAVSARSMPGRSTPGRSVTGRSMPGRSMSARSMSARGRAARPVATPPVRLTRRGRLVVRVGSAGLVLLALTAGVLLIDRTAQAGSTSRPVPVSYRVVLPGETLWQIAGEIAPTADRRDTVARILDLNALSTAGVAAGQRIAVPVQTP